MILRVLIYGTVFVLSIVFFGWVGLVIAPLLSFGISQFFGRPIKVDQSEPLFAKTSYASLWDAQFFELFGYLCKVDGVITRDEIAGVEVVFNHLEFDQEKRAEAIAAFNRGKDPSFNFGEALDTIRGLHLRQDVAISLIHLMNVVVTNADGSGLIAEERNLLYAIGSAFGLTVDTITQVLFLGQGEGRSQSGQSRIQDKPSNVLEIAYETLGIQKDSAPKDMKRRYRRLRGNAHPDRLPKSASPAEREAAEKRFTEIQRAWDIVRVQHGI